MLKIQVIRVCVRARALVRKYDHSKSLISMSRTIRTSGRGATDEFGTDGVINWRVWSLLK